MRNEFKKRSFLYFTIVLIAGSLSVHYYTAELSYKDEQQTHNQQFDRHKFNIEFMRQIMENWESEFIQIFWQVGGLWVLYAVGSAQDKGGDRKKEKMLEEILRRVNPVGAEQIIKDLNDKYQ